MTLTFDVRSAVGPPMAATIELAPKRVVLGGYSARSSEERNRHIDELRQLGIEPPTEVPAFWHVSPYLVTTETRIEVQGAHTSGEIEYALIAHAGRTYVTVASDQTDRELERHSIPRSKQVCPKVLATMVVPLDEVLDEWDAIAISSEVSTDGRRWEPYQRSTLASMMDPPALIRAAWGTDALADGTVLLSGTVPLLDGVTRFDAHFRGAMTIPRRAEDLTLAYRVDVLPEIVTKEVTA